MSGWPLSWLPTVREAPIGVDIAVQHVLHDLRRALAGHLAPVDAGKLLEAVGGQVGDALRPKGRIGQLARIGFRRRR